MGLVGTPARVSLQYPTNHKLAMPLCAMPHLLTTSALVSSFRGGLLRRITLSVRGGWLGACGEQPAFEACAAFGDGFRLASPRAPYPADRPTIELVLCDSFVSAPLQHCFRSPSFRPPPRGPLVQGELANALGRRKSSGAGGPGMGGPPAVPGAGGRSPPPSMPAPMPGRGAPMPARPGFGAPSIPGKVCV